jgi:pimeloyl-ACP methyl ester carboxylesterase
MPHCELNGASIWYDDWSGAGEPILLHHGYTASRENWGYDGASRRGRPAECTSPGPPLVTQYSGLHLALTGRCCLLPGVY